MLTNQLIKILVAEDDLFWFDFLKLDAQRRTLPLRFIWTPNGVGAIEQLKSGKIFDALLMNLEMPCMDGISATYKVRELGYKLPIIAWTSYESSEKKKECFEAGMNAFIEKNGSKIIEDVIEALHKCEVFQRTPPQEA